MSQTNQGNRPVQESDPLIDEVREIRRKLSDRCGDDIERLIEYLRQVEREHPGPIITPADLDKKTA